MTASTNPITTGPARSYRSTLIALPTPNCSSASQPRQLSHAARPAITTVGRYSRLLTRADISPGTVPLPGSVAVLTPTSPPTAVSPGCRGWRAIPGVHVLVNVAEPARVQGRRGPAGASSSRGAAGPAGCGARGPHPPPAGSPR